MNFISHGPITGQAFVEHAGLVYANDIMRFSVETILSYVYSKSGISCLDSKSLMLRGAWVFFQ